MSNQQTPELQQQQTTTASTRGTTSASIRATRSTSTKASTAAAKADTEADYVAIKTITISTRARFPAVSAATDMFAPTTIEKR
ncbi:10030_t:CDS:2 [Entrophospora sp. SA101]|nr:10030_t:CDS:2 [Entrophospora sp. SA101]